ncbi:UNVERIFIED_CONTAM: hypothetical protein Sradi_5308100 [Sesamum radiatum]|uniref:Reverse transcriptase domain-containing protein n=1 Tax=Sesamum radiatum TaxID=300843 RepID=A0AAW2LQK9_SESRA
MSKSIANRLNPFLDSLIFPSQAAFVPGRIITDNVLVAYELSHFLKHKSKEVLSGMLRRAEHMGLIQGVAVSRSAPRVSHLLFADGALVFCSATTEAMACIRQILVDFERASGLTINSHKPTIVFSRNVEGNRRLELAGILGVMVVPKHDKYLDLPTISGRSKKYYLNGVF